MERINKSPSYLLRVGTRYHFRFVFPKTYCNLLAGEVRLSLQTGSLRKARPLAAMLAQKTKELLESSEPQKMTITKQEIKAALGSYLRASLELNEESRYRGTNLNDLRAVHDGMKAKAAALTFTNAFFNGDSTVNAKEFDGLRNRLTGSQVIDMGNSDGGDALTLDRLDVLIDAVQGGPEVLFMNKAMRRKVNALMRAAGQATETVTDAFGRQINAYAGVPIAVIEDDKDGNLILDFNEPDLDNGDKETTTSIYAVRFGVKEWVSGLLAGTATNPIEVIDQGLNGIFYETLVEMIASLAIFHPKAAARLRGIANA